MSFFRRIILHIFVVVNLMNLAILTSFRVSRPPAEVGELSNSIAWQFLAERCDYRRRISPIEHVIDTMRTVITVIPIEKYRSLIWR